MLAACQPEAPAADAGTGDAVQSVPYAPPGTPIELGIAGYAKVLCSAVYVSGRSLDEASRHSGLFFIEPSDRPGVSAIEHNETARAVSVSHGDSVTRTARYHGDQGCIIDQRSGPPGPFFTPVPVESRLPPADDMAWPMGDRTESLALAAGVDAELLQQAERAATEDPAGLTQAFLVMHEGQIVVEWYAPGVDRNTQLESWSMGKSLTATLAGILVQDGTLELDAPAPVPEWQEPGDPGDPRGEITLRQLLQMSSGLRFIAPRDPDYTPELGYPDHMFIYSGAIDAFAHSITRPPQFPPGTEGRYRNSDPLTVGYLVKRAAQQKGEEYLTFPQRILFDRIGIRRQVLETDPYGNFLLTGYDYGTARNWARLALLYLSDGVWLGERILPEGYVEFVSTPAPAWDEPVYGGFFWLNRTGEWSLPEDAFYMSGGGGQRVFVVPSLDLAVVRLGHFEGSGPGMEALDRALGLVWAAVDPARR